MEFSPGLIELVGRMDGMSMLTTSGRTLTDKGSIELNFGFTALKESISTGIPIIAAIKKRGCQVNYEDGQEAIEAECLLGLARVAAFFMIDAGDMTEDQILAAEFLIEGRSTTSDKEMEELSCTIAYEIMNNGNLEDLLTPDYSLKKANVTKPKSAPKLDLDDAAYTRAARKGDNLSYKAYLKEYPSGRNVSKARNKLKELEPFQYDAPIKIGDQFSIQFRQGIGTKMPDVEFSDNKDYAIKHEWVPNNWLLATLPEERSTVMVVSLGGKQASISLGNAFPELTAKCEKKGKDGFRIFQVAGGKPPYSVVAFKDGSPVKTLEIGNVSEYTLLLAEWGMNGEGVTLQLMDVRKVAVDLGKLSLHASAMAAKHGSKWIWLLPIALWRQVFY
ncbi:MAG: hypothetical protein IPM82_07465 [Saprospiraceae bacterium]|nr:hypothetical protein [Saprospiraceae bacterium]